MRFIKDPGFWFLVLINSYLIYYYQGNPGEFNTIVWIFWVQSVLIGVFNFFDLYTVKDPDEKSMTINKQPISKSNMGCAAFFFLFHYGIFHFVYGVFLLTGYSQGAQSKIILITAGIFLIESTWQFIRRKMKPADTNTNVGLLFFTPYLRIFPMHLMLILPSFLGMSGSVLFLVLKMVADVGMYLLTSGRMKMSTSNV